MEGKNEDILSNISSIEETDIDNIANYEVITNGYTCDKCNSIPEIENIDYINNTILIKCPNHETQISINNFINDTLKHNFYFSVCNICNEKIQKENNSIFKYCYDCNKIICDECAIVHDKSHKLINNNDYNNKCVEHFNQKYTSFCYNCDKNICNECKKTKIHKEHKKNDFIEIEPTKDEFDQINNFCLKLRKSLDSLKISGKIEIEELKNNKNNIIKIIQQKFKEQLNNFKKNADNRLDNNFNLFEKMKKSLYDKYVKEINELNIKYNSIKSKIEEELKNNSILCQNNYVGYKNKIEYDYNSLIIKCRKYYKELRIKYADMIKLNEIIINSYYKNKTQYYYINNVINDINCIKIYNNEASNLYFKRISDKYNSIIKEEIIKIKDTIISNEGLKNIISKINKENLCNISIISSQAINKLNDLNFLGDFNYKELRALCIVNCNVTNIDSLKNIQSPKLIKLDLSSNMIKNINILKYCNIMNLKYLSLKKNNICDITVLIEDIFSNLEDLDLSDNLIQDIKILNKAKFIKIKDLNISFNLIKNIDDFKKNNYKYLKKYNAENQSSDINQKIKIIN